MAAEPCNILKVCLESHFLEVSGEIFADIAFAYDYWKEYLAVFDRVEPIARVSRAERTPEGWRRADGPGVRFHRIHDYRGFWEFLRYCPRILRDCGRALAGSVPVLLRSGPISMFCGLHLMLGRRAYAVEEVGHRGDEASTVRHVQILGLGRVIGFLLHNLGRCVALQASCAGYVSNYVRSLYPTRSRREWVFSGVKLPESAFAAPRPTNAFEHGPRRIVSVGRLEPAKGHEVLIRAMSELSRNGRNDFVVEIVGPGGQIDALRRLSETLGLSDCINFPGYVQPGEPLRTVLDRSDLFVLPSLTEGMPRALLEAMARGLPAIGSRTGGIIELLDDDGLVEPGDAVALSKRIGAVLNDVGTLARMSAASVKRAREYHEDQMRLRKHAFWRQILAMDNPAESGTASGRRL